MYRSVILDFLSMNRTQLNNYKFKQATVSLLGRFNQKDISSLLLRADEIITYHVNEPRIYEKTYSFEVFSQTICDMVVFTKQQIYLTKDQLTTINDPFYLKDIKLIDFTSIVLIPIIKNEDVVGTIIFYFDDFAKDFKCKQSDLMKLFNSLQDYQSSLYENQISKAIFDNEDYVKVVYLKNEMKCYIDNILKHKFHLKSNIIDLNDKSIAKRIEKEINSKKYHFISSDLFQIYYINKFDYQQSSDSLPLLAFTNINNHLNDKFTLVFINNDTNDDVITSLFSDFEVKKYFVSNTLIVYLLSSELKNKDISELTSKIKYEYLLTLTSKTITPKMNLVSLINFVNETRPSEFNLNSYVEYLNNLHSIELYSNFEVAKDVDMIFINSLKKEFFGVLPLVTSFKLETKTIIDQYVNNLYKFINNLIKENIEGYIIPIIPSMFDNNKIFVALQRLQEFDKNLKVLVFIPNYEKDNIKNLEKGISKLKKQGLYVIVDSTIYFNNKTLYLLDLCDGIYVHQDEYETLLKYPGGINTAIFHYMIKNYKEILIDYPLNKVTDAYFNALIYYLK